MKELKTFKYWFILNISAIFSVLFTNHVLHITSDVGIILSVLITIILNFILQRITFNNVVNSIYENGEEVYREENGKTIIDKRKK